MVTYGIKLNYHRITWCPGLVLTGLELMAICLCGVAEVSLVLAGVNFLTEVVVASGIMAEAILDLDFMEKNECIIEIAQRTLKFAKLGLSLPLDRHSSAKTITEISVMLLQTVSVPMGRHVSQN